MWTWLYICNFKFLIVTSISWIEKPLVNLSCTSLGILESEIQLVWRGTPTQGSQLKVQLLIRDLYRYKTYLFLAPCTQNLGYETMHQYWHSLKNSYRFSQNLNHISLYKWNRNNQISSNCCNVEHEFKWNEIMNSCI